MGRTTIGKRLLNLSQLRLIYTLDSSYQETAYAAKLFSIGRSQAVRLSKQFRFSGTEVFIRRKPSTGEVVLSPKLSTWQDFFELVNHSKLSADFMSDRQDALAEERNLF